MRYHLFFYYFCPAKLCLRCMIGSAGINWLLIVFKTFYGLLQWVYYIPIIPLYPWIKNTRSSFGQMSIPFMSFHKETHAILFLLACPGGSDYSAGGISCFFTASKVFWIKHIIGMKFVKIVAFSSSFPKRLTYKWLSRKTIFLCLSWM